MIRRETEQRGVVYEAARLLYHPTAEEVYDKLSSENSGIARATVFRNLSVLAEEGKLVKLSFPDQPARYDTNTVPHDHFVCKVCGKIIDLDGCRAVVPPRGLNVTSSSVTFYGICPDCTELFGGKPIEERKVVIGGHCALRTGACKAEKLQ